MLFYSNPEVLILKTIRHGGWFSCLTKLLFSWSVSNPPQILMSNFGISFFTAMFSLFHLYLALFLVVRIIGVLQVSV